MAKIVNIISPKLGDLIAEAKAKSKHKKHNIPHVSKDHPSYNEYCAGLEDLKNKNPVLHSKILNWD